MAEAGAAFMKTLVLQTIGYAFLVLGVIGLVVPILQGFLFLAIGLIILAKSAPWAERMLGRFKNSHPDAGRLIDKADAKVHEWGRKAMTFLRQKG
ncbi:MAG: PGPGW domain-containing protein [Alphaproteobacteria bacterium]|nr:PGPGW domain-containing protein [Alphaproteobacteria bacterium]